MFKKPSKFQNFYEIFYCGLTRLRNTNLECFYIMSVHKNHFKKQKYGTELFKKHSKFQKFQLSNFTLTWSNEGKMNSVRPDLT